MNSYPKIISVSPLNNKKLRVTFETGITKLYDCTPLLKETPFVPLKDEYFFRNVHADHSGYGIVWNDEVDLSESEIWIHGTTDRDSPSPSQGRASHTTPPSVRIAYSAVRLHQSRFSAKQ